MHYGRVAWRTVEGVDVVTYPRDLDREMGPSMALDRDHSADAVAVAEDVWEGPTAGSSFSTARVPERAEATAAYGACSGCGEPWPCAEVRRLSKEWEEG